MTRRVSELCCTIQQDLAYTLLPRSTGLQYSLRSLSPRLPTLKLLDITVAYPGTLVIKTSVALLTATWQTGIPPYGYGQDYYTLRPVFMDRVPPPVIHMHLRLFDVASSVPIGDLSQTDSTKIPAISTSTTNGYAHAAPHVVEIDIPEEEHVRFDEWLRDLWREKDAKFEEYYEKGGFSSAAATLEIPLRLRRKREVLDSFCFFGPLLLGYALTRLSKVSC